MSTDDWRHSAACRGMDPELFFPEAENAAEAGRAAAQVRTAREVCLACPVMQQCREWAVDHRIRHGVWGGLSRTQRREATTDANRKNRGAA